MARDKFVVRLLDATSTLLAWAEVYAEPRPQDRAASCPFWPVSDTIFVVERSGLATELTVHWCDLDLARRSPLMEPSPVHVGQVFTFAWLEPIWLVAGMRDVPLPAVTVQGPIVIHTPVGTLVSAPPT